MLFRANLGSELPSTPRISVSTIWYVNYFYVTMSIQSIQTEYIDDSEFFELDSILSQAEKQRTPPKPASNIQSSQFTTTLPTRNVLPNNSLNNSQVLNNTSTPSPNKNFSPQTYYESLHQKNTKSSNGITPTPLQITVEAVLKSPKEFAVKHSKHTYDILVPYYQNIPRSQYNIADQIWLFPTDQYYNWLKLIKNIPNLNVKITPLYPPVVNTFIDRPNQSNIINNNNKLDKLPITLLDSLYKYQREGILFGIKIMEDV